MDEEERSRGEESIDDEEDSFDDYVEELPHELRKIRHMVFENQDQLEQELYSRGFSDVQLELHPKTRKAVLKLTSGLHDDPGSLLKDEFNEYYKPSWGYAGETRNVFMQKPPGKQLRRKPDIAFWGPAKCFRKGLRVGRGAFRPKYLVEPPQIFGESTREHLELVNPDVVVQISLGNSVPYEFDAINDLMNNVKVDYPNPQPDNQAPRLGFLIKIHVFKGKRTRDGGKIIKKIDVYRLLQGTTIDDAIAGNNRASLRVYTPGDEDEVEIRITAEDLGVTNPGDLEPFVFTAKEIYDHCMRV